MSGSPGLIAPPGAAPVAFELTILMPCLNEANTVALCVRKALGFLQSRGIAGEVLVADNGSSDGSQALAAAAGARVVEVPERGYGAALLGGIRAARGRYVIMGDADDSYDFSALDGFVERLRSGNALVMGNRFKGGIEPGAMPALHRYLGNPVLTGLGRLLFRSPAGDFHCGLRGFDRERILALGLDAPGMEFASEMVVKATLQGLPISETPVTLRPDGRGRPPHLKSWRDGWRHLRFLLMLSPGAVLLYPGLLLVFAGLFGVSALAGGDLRVGALTLSVHTLIYAAAAVVAGAQLVLFWLFARRFAVKQGLLPAGPWLKALSGRLTFERLLVAGLVFLAAGLTGAAAATGLWAAGGFGPIETDRLLRLSIVASAAIVLGVQFAFAAFVFHLVGQARRT